MGRMKWETVSLILGFRLAELHIIACIYIAKILKTKHKSKYDLFTF